MIEPSSSLSSPTPHQTGSRWLPIGMSFLMHGILIVILLLVVSQFTESVTEPRDRIGQIVHAVSREKAQFDYLEENDFTENREDTEYFLPAADTLPPPVASNQAAAIELAGNVPVEIDISPDRLATSKSGSVPDHQVELTADDLKMIEADQKLIASRKPAGPATSLRVFGSGQLTGRSFVFLIDRSDSMGDQGLGVLKLARLELTNAINQLEPHHRFQIIAYHDRTTSISRRQLLAAGLDNKRLVPEFLQNLSAFGGTSHQSGVYAALAFDPDVIVMLTDGGLPGLHGGQLKAICKATRPGTEIHTFQFGRGPRQSMNMQNFLEQLAEQNSGTYRYIDIRQWNRPDSAIDQP